MASGRITSTSHLDTSDDPDDDPSDTLSDVSTDSSGSSEKSQLKHLGDEQSEAGSIRRTLYLEKRRMEHMKNMLKSLADHNIPPTAKMRQNYANLNASIKEKNSYIRKQNEARVAELKLMRSFFLFPKLPVELRLKIWSFTVPGNLVHSEEKEGGCVTRSMPIVLHVCQESRAAYLKDSTGDIEDTVMSPKYVLCRPFNTPRSHYVSFTNDAILISGRFDWVHFDAITKANLEHLAMKLNPSPFVNKRFVASLLRLLNLKKLTILLELPLDIRPFRPCSTANLLDHYNIVNQGDLNEENLKAYKTMKDEMEVQEAGGDSGGALSAWHAPEIVLRTARVKPAEAAES